MVKKKDQVNTEVDEMLEEFFPVEEPPVEIPPVETPPEETPPVEEVPIETPPVEALIDELPPEVPPVEEPPGEVPPVETPIEDEETPEQELARLRSQNTLLIQRIEDQVGGPAPVAPKVVETPPIVPPIVPPVVAPIAPPAEVADIDFIKGRTLEELIDDPKGLNQLLNEVYKKGIERGGTTPSVEPIVERILNSLPGIVQVQVTQQNAIRELVTDFYKNNEDLMGVRRTVAAFANEVHSENPDWETKNVFSEAGVRTRKALGMRERAAKQTTTPTTRPAFARTRGARKGGEKELTGIEKEISELIN